MVQRAFLPQGTGHRSAFGDQLQVKLDPKVAIKAVYGARSDTETFTATGGAITATGAEFVLTTGTSVGGYGVLSR